MSNTHPLFIFVVLSTVLGGVISNSVYAQEDWQRAASAAGLDESGLGAPTQRSMLIKQQLQKAEAERAAREKTYTAQKAKQDHAQKVIAEANKNLKTVTDNYGQSLATQQQLIQGIQERAAQTQARKKSAETALKKLGTINRYNPFSDESDKRVKLQAEIDDATSTLKAQSKHLKERLTKFNTTRKEAESLANQYKMQAIKSLPEQKAAEEKRRLDALKEYRQEYDTTAAKMVEADKRFDAKSKYLKTKISEAKKSGKGTTVYENALADLKINQDAFLQSYSGRLTTIKRDLNRQYSDNKRDGLGISSPVKLDEVLQSEANAAGRGGDGPRLINQAALSSANASVNRTITSKNTNSQHINVFDNPDSLAAWEEFGTDVRTEYVSSLKDQYNLVGQAKAIEKAITTGDTSDLKKQNRLLGRSIAVAKGGTLGVKDAVVGTVEFAYSGIKFTVQSSAVAVDTYSDWLGSKTDLTSVFGKDAAELGWKGVAGANDILYGMTAGELFNDKSAKQLSIANSESLLGMLVDKPYDKFSREFEKAAASGETGIQKGVEKFTQAGVNVIGGEEAIFGAIIKTGSGAAKLFNKADVLADVSKQAFLKLDLDSPLVRNLDLGPIPELPPRRLGPLPGDEGVLNIPVVASSKIERPKAPATGKAAMIDGVDGAKIYKAPDGSIFELGEVIGTGSTSTTYAVKGQPDRVVKITKKAESGENLNAYAGDVLDDIGTNLVKGIDPNLLPQQIGSKQTLNARESVTVLERFDDVKKFQEASTAASGVARHEVKMTNGQLRAYREMMDKLNDKGVVFMDNKLDNWSLVKVEGKLILGRLKLLIPAVW